MTCRNRLVAVVDDDPAVSDSTRLLLEAYGIDVRAYRSGVDFLKEYPDVACLVVDYHMPTLDGFAFIEELRRRGGQMPVIMITAAHGLNVEVRAAELGIKRVLRKPFSNQGLIDAIREQLSPSG